MAAPLFMVNPGPGRQPRDHPWSPLDLSVVNAGGVPAPGNTSQHLAPFIVNIGPGRQPRESLATFPPAHPGPWASGPRSRESIARPAKSRG